MVPLFRKVVVDLMGWFGIRVSDSILTGVSIGCYETIDFFRFRNFQLKTCLGLFRLLFSRHRQKDGTVF